MRLDVSCLLSSWPLMNTMSPKARRLAPRRPPPCGASRPCGLRAPLPESPRPRPRGQHDLEPDVFSYSLAIRACDRQWATAIATLAEMQQRGVSPTEVRLQVADESSSCFHVGVLSSL